MIVTDGKSRELKLSGYVSEAKCTLKDYEIPLSEIAIGKKFEQRITIRNNYKYSAVFNVQEVPNFTEITPSKGKIGPDGIQLLSVKK